MFCISGSNFTKLGISISLLTDGVPEIINIYDDDKLLPDGTKKL